MNFRGMLSTVMVGIDIQRDAARLVKISRRRRAFYIERLASIPMLPNVFNREIIEDWQQLHDAVSELVIVAEVRNAPVTICMPAGQVEFGSMMLPSLLSPSAIKSAIAAQIGGGESWQIDYTRRFGHTKKESVFSYAATRLHYLRQYVRCMEKCGLNIRHVDIDIYALERAVKYRPFETADFSSANMQHEAGSVQSYHVAAGLALYGV